MKYLSQWRDLFSRIILMFKNIASNTIELLFAQFHFNVVDFRNV